MKLKKLIATFLLISCFSTFMPSIANEEISATNELTLQEFLKTTKDITAKYEYSQDYVAATTQGKSKLQAHSPIIIKCTEAISTKDIVNGSEVHFAIVNNILDEKENILIKAGTPVTASITFKKKELIGRSGEITITDFHTTAVDGTYVPLSGSVSAKPDDKMTMSIVLSVLICPLFLLLKGEDARVEAGATKTAYTIADMYIKPTKS